MPQTLDMPGPDLAEGRLLLFATPARVNPFDESPQAGDQVDARGATELPGERDVSHALAYVVGTRTAVGRRNGDAEQLAQNRAREIRGKLAPIGTFSTEPPERNTVTGGC